MVGATDIGHEVCVSLTSYGRMLYPWINTSSRDKMAAISQMIFSDALPLVCDISGLHRC